MIFFRRQGGLADCLMGIYPYPRDLLESWD
jgi:hypothetical protein